jgi:hypothetical protein
LAYGAFFAIDYCGVPAAAAAVLSGASDRSTICGKNHLNRSGELTMTRTTRAGARIAVAVALLSACWLVTAAGSFELLTPDEYQQEKDAQSLVLRGATGKEEPESQRAADGPVINVVTPSAKNTVKAPVDIDVRFEPGPGAKIQIDTLRIRYGMIGLDVTDRIRKAATVTEQGIRAPGAQLPAGSHSMSVEIADTAGRKTKQSFKFKVTA